MLSFLFQIFQWVVRLTIGSFIPIGNEMSTVRRIPLVTFSIMVLSVLVYFVTLPGEATALKGMISAGMELEKFMEQNPQLVADDEVRHRLIETGLLTKTEGEAITNQLKQSADVGREYESWLRGPEAMKLREEFNQKLGAFVAAREGRIANKFGFAPNGKWKPYQFVTYAFLHEVPVIALLPEHLLYNMVFFFAVAFVLEDLWGRGTFLGFYLLGAAVSALPFAISPSPAPLIGASGAISATMGAFLIRLPKTRIKLMFWPSSFMVFFLGKKRPVVMIPSYIYLIAYFIVNLVFWYVDKQAGGVSGVAFSVHVAGFMFGAGFAYVMKATRYEETHINPKLEAKVSFGAPEAVTQGLELIDKGQLEMAERKLRSHLAQNQDSLEAILGLIQVYEKTASYDQLNAMYARLIRHHLSGDDKEAALYAYDNLLSALPDKGVRVRIASRDWMAICEYLREVGMTREAAVEYERLVNAWPDDPNAVRAAVQGAEMAMISNDPERALRMFVIAEQLNPPQPFISRIQTGMEKCQRILANRPDLKRKQTKPPAFTY
jgi:membrane associated rhomboid family serine protease